MAAFGTVAVGIGRHRAGAASWTAWRRLGQVGTSWYRLREQRFAAIATAVRFAIAARDSYGALVVVIVIAAGSRCCWTAASYGRSFRSCWRVGVDRDMIRVAMDRIRIAMDRIRIAMDRIRAAMDRIRISIDMTRARMDGIRTAMDRIRVVMDNMWDGCINRISVGGNKAEVVYSSNRNFIHRAHRSSSVCLQDFLHLYGDVCTGEQTRHDGPPASWGSCS